MTLGSHIRSSKERPKMDNKPPISLAIKGLKLTVFISLLVVSIYFVKECIIIFTDNATTFEVTSTERIIIETPTMTICLNPGYKMMEFTDIKNYTEFDDFEYFYKIYTYHIGLDFNLTVSAPLHDNQYMIINNEGFYEMMKNSNGYSYSLEVKPVITNDLGLCYEFISRSSLVGYEIIDFLISLNPMLESKPKSAMIVLTSEENAKGVAYNTWIEGNEMIFQTKFGKDYQQKINLNMKNIEYLPKTSKCSETSSAYDCVAQMFYKGNYSDCSKPCIPYSWQYLLNSRINNSLPICSKLYENECMTGLMKKNVLKSFKECPRSCKSTEYHGSIYRQYFWITENWISENPEYSKWSLEFSSKTIITETEALVFDEISMIVYVGGVFGLFIGFSFYDSIIKLIHQFCTNRNLMSI